HSAVNGENPPPIIQPPSNIAAPPPPAIGPEPAPALAPEPPPPRRTPGWWIHWLLMAALPIAVLLLGMGRSPFRGPALTHSVNGLLYVCAIQIVIFGILFLLAWLASRASSEQLLLEWRPGFWVVPLGLGYSLALRLALMALGLILVTILLLTHIVSPKDFEHFARSNA